MVGFLVKKNIETNLYLRKRFSRCVTLSVWKIDSLKNSESAYQIDCVDNSKVNKKLAIRKYLNIGIF